MVISLGCTRYVILTKNYAFKLPRLDNRNYFNGLFCGILKSLCANIAEYRIYKYYRYKTNILCPIVFHLPFGLLNVMPRCTESNTKFTTKNAQKALRAIPLQIEKRPHNFGYLNKKIVCFDYH